VVVGVAMAVPVAMETVLPLSNLSQGFVVFDLGGWGIKRERGLVVLLAPLQLQ
jgi:hypothetical protein